MDCEIHCAPFFFQRVKGSCCAVIIQDIVIDNRFDAHFFGQLLCFVAKHIHLNAKGQFGTFGQHGLCDAVGNRTIVCDAGDKAALAFQKV